MPFLTSAHMLLVTVNRLWLSEEHRRQLILKVAAIVCLSRPVVEGGRYGELGIFLITRHFTCPTLHWITAPARISSSSFY